MFRHYVIIYPRKRACMALNELESPLAKDALCEVWLKLAQWFWWWWNVFRRTERGQTDDGQQAFRKVHLSEKTLTTFKNLRLKNHEAIFNETWHKASFGWFVCLFGVHRHTREFFIHKETSPSPSPNFDLCSALMAIEQRGFFGVPYLLWHGASVYTGQVISLSHLMPGCY